MSESPIFDALDCDHSGVCGGQAGGWGARVSCLLGTIVAVGVRALARRAAGARGSVAHAPPGALRRVRDDACALALLDGSAPARRGGDDRRGAAPSGRRRRASSDCQAARTARRNGAWLAACRQATRRKPACVRDRVDHGAGARTGRGYPGRQLLGRRGRGDHARRSRAGAAVRSRRPWPMGTRGLADRRATARSPVAAAVIPVPSRSCPPARPGRHPAAHGDGGSSAATAVHGLVCARLGA